MICGILLAAGSGERFGRDKRLVPVGEQGRPMLNLALEHLSAGVNRVVVVLRPGDEGLATWVREQGAQAVICPRAERGMGASLACGVGAAPYADGWLIALADMPAIKPETLRLLADGLRQGDAIVAPYLGSRRGHPIGFSRAYYDRLVVLDGDRGARQLLEDEAASVTAYTVDDPGVIHDIDVPGDLPR
jgi:molybdenum cofactor cytidylyltransferase